MRYRAEKCKGSKFYKVVKAWDGRTFTSLQFETKKKALKYCAELEGISFKEYMKIYRKETGTVPSRDCPQGENNDSD